MREGDGRTLHVRRSLRVQEHVPVRGRLRLQRQQVGSRTVRGERRIAPLFSSEASGLDGALVRTPRAAWLAAGAIDAAAFRTGTAPVHHPLAQGLASTEDADTRIVRG